MKDFLLNKFPSLSQISCLGFVLLVNVLPLSASSITFEGSLLRDDDIRVFTIVVDTPTSAHIRSTGYAGDPNSDIGFIPSGGFDTYLTVFDSTGTFVVENDDGENATIDPTTGQAFDAQLQQNLNPGTYSLWLTQYGNYALGSNDTLGFSEVGHSTYTNDPDFTPGDPCPSGLFKDSSGSSGACRNGNYSIEFTGDGAFAYYALVEPSPQPSVPEPVTQATVIVGLGTIALIVHCRRREMV